MPKAPAYRRQNSRGRVDDVAYGLLHEWNRGNVEKKKHPKKQPTEPLVTISEMARRLNIARSTVTFNLRRTVPPSARACPVPPRADQAAIDARRAEVKRLLKAHKEIVAVKKMKRVPDKIRKKIVFLFRSPAAIRRELGRVPEDEEEEPDKMVVVVSKTTIVRDIAALGFKAYKSARVPFLLEHSKEKRVVNFTLMCDAYDEDELEAFLFSDETWMDSNNHGVPWQYCEVGERPQPIEVEGRGRVKVHLWIIIGVGVKRLVVFPEDVQGHIDAAAYIENCLEKCKDLFPNRVFVEDNAKPHTAAKTMTWKTANNVTTPSVDWPPYSPDANPVENLHNTLKAAVSARGPWDRSEIVKFVHEEFEKIPQSHIDKLCRSFRSRMQQIIAVKGNAIPY